MRRPEAGRPRHWGSRVRSRGTSRYRRGHDLHGMGIRKLIFRVLPSRPRRTCTSPLVYMLSSLVLFKPAIVVTVVVAIVGITLWTRGSDLLSGGRTLTGGIARILRTSSRLRSLNKRLGRLNQVIPQTIKNRLPDMKYWWKPKGIQAGLGSAITVTALTLYGVTGDVAVSTYYVLALMALGPLLLTSAFRSDPRGRVPYSLAVVVGIVCGVWAASIYASDLGTSAAKAFAAHLPAKQRRKSTAPSRSTCPGPREPPRGFGQGPCTNTAMWDSGFFTWLETLTTSCRKAGLRSDPASTSSL